MAQKENPSSLPGMTPLTIFLSFSRHPGGSCQGKSSSLEPINKTLPLRKSRNKSLALRGDQFRHRKGNASQQKLKKSSFHQDPGIEKEISWFKWNHFYSVQKELIDLEICNDKTELNESSNPSFHTPNPLLTSCSPTNPTCFSLAHWMSLLAVVIARGWETCRTAEMPMPDNHLFLFVIDIVLIENRRCAEV